MKRIDMEAHFLSAALREALATRDIAPYLTPENVMVFGPDCALPYNGLNLDLPSGMEQRLKDMDAAGIDKQVLSCVGGAELLPTEQGIRVARETNDELYRAIQTYPGCFAGYATLAPRDVGAAVSELERCVSELGFVGWNAFSNFGEDALDDPRYFPLLEKAEKLGVFIYLHPTMPTIDRLHGYGRQLVASGLGFGIDVMITLMRMMLAGVFDRLPGLKVVLGHLGEGFPFVMDRMRARGPKQSRLPAVNELAAKDYFPEHVWVSTSGNYSVPAFRCAFDALGAEHILLGSDYPMEALAPAAAFIDDMPLTHADRKRINSQNAETFFMIG